MLGNKPMAQWIDEYTRSHQHPVNRLCHTIGIPMIVVAVPLLAAAIVLPALLPVALALFLAGWVLQFAGHIAEGKPPEFLRDWRFLFVGLRWWVAKVRGRA